MAKMGRNSSWVTPVVSSRGGFETTYTVLKLINGPLGIYDPELGMDLIPDDILIS